MAESFNKFAQVAAALKTASGQVVRKTAFDLKANAQAQIRANGQIDTGFMVNGVYVVTSKESTYAGGHDALPEVAKPTDDTSALVASAASYSAAQNYGTVHLPARPFWEPSIDKTKPGFEQAISAIEGKLKEAAS